MKDPRKVSRDWSGFTLARVVFLYKDDRPERLTMLYAQVERTVKRGKKEVTEEFIYVPSCGRLIWNPGYDDAAWHDYLPVWAYTGWAQSKVDDTKFKVAYGTMPLSSVLPDYLWEGRS